MFVLSVLYFFLFNFIKQKTTYHKFTFIILSVHFLVLSVLPKLFTFYG
jgi:hypothetical protein